MATTSPTATASQTYPQTPGERPTNQLVTAPVTITR